MNNILKKPIINFNNYKVNKIPPVFRVQNQLTSKNPNYSQNNDKEKGGNSLFQQLLKEKQEQDKFFNNMLKKPILNFADANSQAGQNTINNLKKKAIPIKGLENKTEPIKKKEVVKVNLKNNTPEIKDINSRIKKEQKTAEPISIDSGLRKPVNNNEEKNKQNAQNFFKTGGTSSGVTNTSSGGSNNVNPQSPQPQPQQPQPQPQNGQAGEQNPQEQNNGQNQQAGFVEQAKDVGSQAIDKAKNVVGEAANYMRDGYIEKTEDELKRKAQSNADAINKKAKDYNEEIDKRFGGSATRDKIEERNNKMKALEMDIDKNVKNGWGIQKYAALGGAVFGAISKYKADLERWEYECQRAAAEGRPMPKKPSLAGSMAMGAAGGGAAGFMVGGVGKHVFKGVDQNLKAQGRNKSLNRFLEKRGLTEQNLIEKDTWKNMNDSARKQWANKEIKSNIQKGNTAVKKYANILSKGGTLTLEQVNYMRELQRSDAGLSILKKIFPGQDISKVLEDARYKASAFFSNVAYVAKCFSIIEDLRADAENKIAEYKELYDFYTLHMNEEPMDVNSFLRECFDYPSFCHYIREAMQLFIEKQLTTFADVFPSMISNGHINNVVANYKAMYKDYQDTIGTNLDPQEFIERCVMYPSYVDYIYQKIKRTKLLKLGLQSFAQVGTTSLPQNVKINGENIDTTEEGLPDAKNLESMNNQNSLQTKEQQAKARQAQLQKQKEDQQKQQQIEANKANYAKTMNAKMEDKINKLSQKKASIAKNIGKNASDMQVGQLAQEKQKVTDLNLKIQQVKADTKNKIAGYKGTGNKQFSFILRKPR